MMPAEEIEQVERAKLYPFAVPVGSYVLVNQRALPLSQSGDDPLALDAMLVEDHPGESTPLPDLLQRLGIATDEYTQTRRTAVLSYGSNCSADALARKFSYVQRDVVVPVVEGSLRHFDAVFSAHITSYGSIPATLQRSEGTELRVFMLALTDFQLQLMHLSEGPYAFLELTGLELTLGGSHALASAFTYISRNGATTVNGIEVSLSTLTARNRAFPARSELEMLSWLRDRLDPGADLDQFILAPVLDPAIRRERTAWLHRQAKPFAGSASHAKDP